MEQEEQRLRKELASFEQVKFGKIKIKIFKEYKLSEAKLMKILEEKFGPAINTS